MYKINKLFILNIDLLCRSVFNINLWKIIIIFILNMYNTPPEYIIILCNYKFYINVSRMLNINFIIININLRYCAVFIRMWLQIFIL